MTKPILRTVAAVVEVWGGVGDWHQRDDFLVFTGAISLSARSPTDAEQELREFLRPLRVRTYWWKPDWVFTD